MIDDPRLPERFWAKVSPEPNTGCWLWTGSTNHHGYGNTSAGRKGKTALAHRFSYEALVGPIQPGLQLDHLCRTRACVNPAHMEPVTAGENTRRGRTGEATRARILARTHCPAGHAYEGDNLYVAPSGFRGCRACHRERELARYHARKAS